MRQDDAFLASLVVIKCIAEELKLLRQVRKPPYKREMPGGTHTHTHTHTHTQHMHTHTHTHTHYIPPLSVRVTIFFSSREEEISLSAKTSMTFTADLNPSSMERKSIIFLLLRRSDTDRQTDRRTTQKENADKGSDSRSVAVKPVGCLLIENGPAVWMALAPCLGSHRMDPNQTDRQT